MRPPPVRPTALDLFSGCGGLTTGLRLAGFSVLGAIELDPLAVATYRLNHPKVRVWESDIRQVRAIRVLRELRLRPGDLDLLAGCPPCQGFSTLRTMNGVRRNRDGGNNLLFEFLRFVRVLRPKALLMENVPALASNWRLPLFRRRLHTLGYYGSFRVIDAATFGVPQRRRRMVFLAARAAEPFFAAEPTTRRTVRDAIAHLPAAGRSGDPAHDLPEVRSLRIARLIAAIPKNGGGRHDLGTTRQLECHKHCDGFYDVYGRMAWDDVAPTITTGFVNPSKGRFLHPSRNRTITLREGALLQTFPSKYRFDLSRGKYAAAQMIGNALPPELIRRQAIAIRAFLASRAK